MKGYKLDYYTSTAICVWHKVSTNQSDRIHGLEQRAEVL